MKNLYLMILLSSLINMSCDNPNGGSVSWHTLFESRVALLEGQVKELEGKNIDTELKLSRVISLNSDSFQTFNDPRFIIVIRSIKSHLSGLIIAGEILNHTSVIHDMAVFKLQINNSSSEFTIKSLGAGSVGSFNVYIPDVPQNSKIAELEYLQSTIKYRK